MISAETVRKSMRITHKLLDEEIKQNIDTALRDMSRVGVDAKKEDELIDKACELYCKAQFDYQGKGEQYQKNYEMLRDSMSLAEEYKQSGDQNV